MSIKTGDAIEPDEVARGIIPQGRLTLESGVAVSTTDQTAKTTVYYTPYLGDIIRLYNTTSTEWEGLAFTEKSVAVPSTTVTPFDIFGYLNSGALALEAVSWTNDTTRATALTTQDGVLVKSGDIGKVYLGTGRTTSSSGQTEDSQQKRLLYNHYNRVPRILGLADDTSHTYGTNAWRYWNNNSSLKAEFILGIYEYQLFNVNVAAYTIGATASVSVGLDGTATVFDNGRMRNGTTNGNQYAQTFLLGNESVTISLGYHYLALLERANNTGLTFDNGRLTALLFI